ncbi:PKD domain-containing protein, partial [Pontibacter sp. Tf4]|uniref:gliding motility-associated C-terminal domain-containing protein n=1 Tax=Pontibacter sp. Tf4 TaxID=2761620 RepID=UPI0016268456
SKSLVNIHEHFINVVIPTAQAASFRLDGAPIAFSPMPSNPALSYAVQLVSAGRHYLKADVKFNAVAYGTIMDRSRFKTQESYGYALHAGVVDDRNQQISFDADLQCGDKTISFSAQTKYPVLSWLWHFGDGNTSTEQFPTHTYDEPGDYDVTLTTVGNDLYNCNSEISTTITLNIAPKAVTTIAAENTCLGNTVRFTAASTPLTGPTAVTEWEWHFGDGTTSSEQNPTHTYQEAATYAVRLVTRTAAGCHDEIVLPNVTVYPLPVAAFQSSPACQSQAVTFTDQSTVADGGAITSWLWEFGDGATSSEQHPTYTYSSADEYQVSLTVTSQNGCVKKTTKTLVVHPLAPAQFTFANTCAGQALTFTNTTAPVPGLTYSWDFGDGTTSVLSSPSHTYTTADNYTVTLTATTQDGCTTTATKEITIYPVPQAAFSPVSVCETTRFSFRDESILASGSITGWEWDFGDGTTSTEQHPSHTYQTAATYRVRLQVTSDKGCTHLLEQDVTAHPLLTATAGEDQLLPYGNPATSLDANVPASGQGTWTIVSGRGGEFSDVHDPKATFTGVVGQTYVLRWLVQGSGCSDAMDDVRISLSVVLSEHLKIPNAFSPNGDGINDTWHLEGIDAFDGVQVKVFNRWGDEVFRTKGYTTPWNGTRNGSSLPDGVYYYVIDAGLGAADVLRGSVTVLR